MILQRLATSIRKQDWFTVLIETLIVVFGVFIGLQVNNWNTERGTKRALAEARALLVEETEQNIWRADVLISELSTVLPIVQSGVDALLGCDTSPEGTELVNAAMKAAVITYGTTFDRDALDTIVNSDVFLARLPPGERQRLKDYSALLRLMQTEIRYQEMRPTDDIFWTAPSVGFSDIYDVPFDSYMGHELTVSLREPVLVVEMQAACRDNELVKKLRIWEHYQSVVPTFAEKSKAAMQANLDALLNEGEAP
ncbi:MAG: hypothetical protein RLN72_10160 [Henriciella sp.]